MVSEEPNKHVLGGTAIRPKKRKGWDKLSHFLHDKDSGTYCSRTPKSWLLITVFYLIYYSCLAGFWYGLLSVFFLTLDPQGPKWKTAESIIGTQPGVGVRPSQVFKNIQSSLFYLDLHFDGTSTSDGLQEDSSRGYATRLQNFFQVYEGNANNPNATACSGEEPGEAEKGKFCRFETSLLGECAEFPYGYNAVQGRLSPCVFVKLNRIFDLVPEPMTEEADFPEGTDDKFKETIVGAGFPKKVYVDCQGEFPADQEAMAGKMKFFPEDQSISLRYFPITTMGANENAMVAVKFEGLPPGRLVHVICKVYYKGVVHSKKEKRGLVTFQLLTHNGKPGGDDQ